MSFVRLFVTAIDKIVFGLYDTNIFCPAKCSELVPGGRTRGSPFALVVLVFGTLSGPLLVFNGGMAMVVRYMQQNQDYTLVDNK